MTDQEIHFIEEFIRRLKVPVSPTIPSLVQAAMESVNKQFGQELATLMRRREYGGRKGKRAELRLLKIIYGGEKKTSMSPFE